MDVGGTFTDVVSVDDESGTVRVVKVATTPQDQSEGFMDGIRAVGHGGLETIDLVCHGTTTGTNAVLERTGACCGLITTRGFRDTLELGMRTRPQSYGLFGEYEPLIERRLRLEVDERMNADGEVLVALAEDQVRAAARRLRAAGVESVLIAFLHAYANPAHEERALEIVLEEWPTRYVTASHQVLSEFREFERISTAAVNAYIQPELDRYLTRLTGCLRERDYANELLIMRSNGGVMRETLASRLSVQTVLSGPAAGVTAAARICTDAGYPNAISADVGGTSFDVAMIVDGIPETSANHQLAYNVPVRLPMIDIHTIGAGGGSIAHLDGTGLLKVGPESAGAQPGPVAYARGGERPTLTDANLVLGRLNPEQIIGVEGGADVDRVRRSIEVEVATPLGLDVEEAAQAIVRIANDRMAGAVRSVSLGRGYDPRDFVYFAFGGGGGLNAVEIARELGIPTVLVPHRPGITSAFGTLVADARHDFVQTINRRVSDVAVEELAEVVARFAEQGARLLEEQKLAVVEVQVRPVVELQYEGQTHTVAVPFAAGDAWDVLIERFSHAHQEAYGTVLDDIAHKVVNVRCAVVGVRPPLDVSTAGAAPPAAAALVPSAHRDVLFAGAWVSTPIYRREQLAGGAAFPGPAIVEQDDGTTVLDPDVDVVVDDEGNLVIRLRDVAHG